MDTEARKQLNRKIIDTFNSLAPEFDGSKFERIFKAIITAFNCQYRDIRIAFMQECDLDLGPKKKSYNKILDFKKGEQEYEAAQELETNISLGD